MDRYANPRGGKVVVTGASSGIGAATVRALAASDWSVVAVARRQSKLEALAKETGCEYYVCDLKDKEAVGKMAQSLGTDVRVVVNIAGGAVGQDLIADTTVEDWQEMYSRNVSTALNVTKAFLPNLREGGDLVFVTSTAAHDTYPGGGGYVAAKHAERMIPLTLRQELVGEDVRLIEIAPGMVKTAEFSLNRLGSQEAADKVYEGVDNPLSAEDVADLICWCLSRPVHVNIDSVIIRPTAQATNTLVARKK
ncbi:SDR family NAD(P)-dependent oxidoreductase [Winkia neuii]|uniref:SDR family NAD(P)-dependent oxidoreductase n=1 Tax=Winkia TaxID=2692118 RepID=UPI000C717AF8|nr:MULTISPECIES: SDR family NAD(P)-dependent oxidoreductase [Winkia]MDK7186130.1 SDR family NAD(P)-dependent oxidoreductase [Winkia sp. UMB1295B]NJJ14626.1 SDR family NAD(P)-dependent oxidoreductase [Winkia neuii]PLB81422.1 oxidoreductase [Actinomyces sp. UMB0138]